MIETLNYKKQIYNKNIIKPYNYDEHNTTTLCVKANMGMGKTKELRKLCNKFDKIIIVTFRVSLGQEFMNKFDDFHFYQNNKGIIDTDVYNKIIVQIDSLNRVEGNCDLFVLDECQYNLLQLVQSDYRIQAFKALMSYIKNSKYFIAIDALFNEDILNYIHSIRNDLVLIENEYKLHSTKEIINYRNNIGPFEETLFKSLNNNKKIIICTNSRKYLKSLEYRIKNIYTNKNILIYDGVKDYTLRLSDWDNADIVGYTPTIVAGISYENKRFDEVYGYFVNTSSSAEMSIQQLFRVRNINNNIYHICTDVNGENNYPVELKEIEETLMKRHNKLIMYSNTINVDNYHKEIIKDDYFNLFINVAKILNLSRNNYEKRLRYLLESQGLKNIYADISKDVKNINKKTRKNINNVKKQLEIRDDEDVVNSRLINEEIYEDYRYSRNLTYEQKCEKNLYTFVKNYKYKGIPTLEEYNKFKKLYKEYNNICFIYANSYDINKVIEKKINFRLERYKENNLKILHNNFRFEKIHLINQFLISTGFTSIFDKNIINIDYNNLYKEIKKYKSDIFKIWSLNEDNRFDNYKDINERNKILLRFLNERLRDLYKIRIIKNKEKTGYIINGLEIWNNISYDREDIKEHILKEQEKEEDEYNFSKNIEDILKEFNISSN